ncbi:phenyloxazoline synthase MbtB [Mycobacteroides abscessus subsp. abscessus]|nr:phenyloxazoline synthase MbtB [Mycobacteroides abscessus subsp. abscessus]
MKIRGYRVELGEVESALRLIPGIRHAVAAIVGTDAPNLVAAVAGTPDPAADYAALLGDLLPGYMIPARIELLEQMPLTSNGGDCAPGASGCWGC